MQTSYKSKKSVVLRGAAKGVAGTLCLLSANAAIAQPAPPIVMSNDAPQGATVVAPPATLPQTQGQLLVSVQFKDVPVSEALSMIAEQGKVDIIVSGDIKETIQNMILTEKTPEQAIRLVTQTANLAWKRLDHTYIIAKSFPEGVKFPSSDSLQPDRTDAQSDLPDPASGSFGVVPALAPMVQPRREVERAVYQVITVRNVAPRIMAYWLDPRHQIEPVEFQGQGQIRQIASGPSQPVTHTFPSDPTVTGSTNYGYAPPNAQPYMQASPQVGNRGGNQQGGNQQGGNQNGNQNGGGAAGIIELPEGVDSIVSIDPQNSILVRGTAAGVNELRTVIALLDRPIPQVEIEAQFVTLSSQDANAFGIDFSGFSNNGNTVVNTNLTPFATDSSAIVTISRNGFSATLQSLISQRRAKVVNSPRITTLNNLTAQLRATSSLFIITSTSNVVPSPNGGVITTQTETVNTFQTGVTLTVTPTINRDGTITIAMQPVVSVPTPVFGLRFPRIDGQTINTISNVKDGDTLAIGGLRLKAENDFTRRIPFLGSLPLVGALFRSKGKDHSESELIIFVTARIVRRTNEPVPGT